jgi:citrate lyase subunit beta/citryl-CoA lyase
MRRSLLFIPSNSPAMLQNADIFSADSIIFDLEDAVAITEKDSARTLLEHYLKTFDLKNIEIIIRINAMESKYALEDIDQVVCDQIDTIMLPKANAADIKILSNYLDKTESAKQMKKKTKIIPIIELASSLLELKEIASSPRVDGLLLGAEDLSTDLEVPRSDSGIEILYARSIVVIHAKAYRIDAIDTPFTNTKDEEGLIRDSKFAASLGMNAKACIHPNQIDIVNQVFMPSIKEIEYAKKVLMAYEDALKLGKGAFSVDGKMVDKPIIERAKILIKKAEKWGI